MFTDDFQKLIDGQPSIAKKRLINTNSAQLILVLWIILILTNRFIYMICHMWQQYQPSTCGWPQYFLALAAN